MEASPLRKKAGSTAGFLLIALSIGCARSRPIDVGRACGPAPAEVEKAWRTAWEEIDEKCGWRADCWRRELESARDLRDRYPEVLLAHRLLVAELRWSFLPTTEERAVRKDLQSEYSRLAARHPTNPAYPYLLASLEPNRKTRRALVEKALALDPAFAWAHDAWVRGFVSEPSEKDRTREHLEAFARSCPREVVEILTLLSVVDDRDAWNALATSLRRNVTPESADFASLPNLWSAEFRYAGPTHYPALRDSIRAAIERLSTLHPDRERKRLEVLRAGYRLTNDVVKQRAAEDTLLANFPCSQLATQVRSERFEAEHGEYPTDDDAAAQHWLASVSEAVKPFAAQCADESLLWQSRLLHLTRWNGADEKDFGEAADRVIAILGRRASQTVATDYLEKGLRLDRVQNLIDDAAELSEEQWAETQASGLEGDALHREVIDRASERCEEQTLRVRLALARKDMGGARVGLTRLAALVEEARHSAASPKEWPTWEEATLWKLRGDAENLAGKPADALADYGRSLRLHPEDRQVRKAARSLYVSLRGGDAGFDKWSEQADQAAKTLTDEITRVAHRPLPDLKMQDVTGRTWTSSELRGKAVFLNVWTTWCGWCKLELPSVQALSDRMKNRHDVAILTMSLDDNPGLIEPFLVKAKYTFPVLVGGSGSYLTWSPNGIPRSYVVDPNGTILEEQDGFSGDSARWLQKTTASLEAALSGSPSTSTAAR